MPKINKTRYAILGVLSMRPGSGYDIKKFCDKGISKFWNENIGHLYPVLKRMEKEGVVTGTEEKREGSPARTVFAITQKGRAELIEWLMQPVEQTPARLELLLKLTFAKNMPAERMLEELGRIRRKHMAALEECLKSEAELNADERVRSDAGYPYWLATVRYGIADARFRIAWCEETIANIRAAQESKKA